MKKKVYDFDIVWESFDFWDWVRTHLYEEEYAVEAFSYELAVEKIKDYIMENIDEIEVFGAEVFFDGKFAFDI